MVTHDDVGTSHNQLMGFHTLAGNWLERVLTTPMQRHNDDGGAVGPLQHTYTLQQRVHWLLANARLVGQIGIVFEC